MAFAGSKLESWRLLSTRMGTLWGKLCARWVLFCVGVWPPYVSPTKIALADVSYANDPGRDQGEVDFPPLIISNHLSWVDVVVHHALFCPSYIARKGTEKLPLLGTMSKIQGCMIVDRERQLAEGSGAGAGAGVGAGQTKRKTSDPSIVDLDAKSKQQQQEEEEKHQEEEVGGEEKDGQTAHEHGVSSQLKKFLLDLEDRRKRGENIRSLLLFPEGTTSNGEGLIQFKRGGFLAGLPIKPYWLQYETGTASAAWESIGILRQLWYLLAGSWTKIEVLELPLYHPTEEEKTNPQLYSENLRRHIAMTVNNVRRRRGLLVDEDGQGVQLFETSLKDKRDYMNDLKELERLEALARQHGAEGNDGEGEPLMDLS